MGNSAPNPENTTAVTRQPLKGILDVTYRCNNNCLHCWLREPLDSPRADKELRFEEIRKIVDEARRMGCAHWSISGGEPMLRPDFPNLLEYITRKSDSCSFHTNGSLISPHIARFLRRKATKIISLFGATAAVHDRVTRTPGSFENTVRGCIYMKEAGASFTVQIVPLVENHSQHRKMIQLAKSLSPDWRIKRSWLPLPACDDPLKRQEIIRQRLEPGEMVKLAQPNPSFEEWMLEEGERPCFNKKDDDRCLAGCIEKENSFHIDPFGLMTFCSLIKDPALRYDLRRGSLKICWDSFIPSLADKVTGGREYSENCGSCDLLSECRWCPAKAYLEHRRLSARVEYLCAIAKETRRHRQHWQQEHRRHFQTGGVTVEIESCLAFEDATFHPKFKPFQASGPGQDTISIRQYYSLPDLQGKDLGEEVYRQAPWVIHKKDDSWIYLGIAPDREDRQLNQVAVLNHGHTRGVIFTDGEEAFRKGGLESLTMLPMDQILLTRVLADRAACYLASGSVLLDGKGLLLAGGSPADSLAFMKMLKDQVEVLGGERVIVRAYPEGFKIYGTWNDGDAPVVPPASASLQAIAFVEQAATNELIPLERENEIVTRLLACLIKPILTEDWWQKMLSLVERVVREVPCYTLRFDGTADPLPLLSQLGSPQLAPLGIRC